jgi:uncharacterized membrane protein YheB (UPF0754 family)
MNYWLLLLPFVSALIGWGIQSLFTRLLFHPVRPKRFAGLTVQGIFPRNQPALAAQLGELAKTEFASLDLEKKVSDPANLDKIMPMIEEHVDDFLRNKLKAQMPVISMFVGEKTIQSLKTVFLQELQTLFPQVMKQFAGNIQSEIDPGKMVAEKIAMFPPEKLEQMLAPQLRTISSSGAIIGFIAGLVQLLFTLLII